MKNSRTFEFVAERTIETIAIQDDIVAFRDTVDINGKKVVVEGISTQSKVDNVLGDEKVPKLERIYLYLKEVKEAHHQENLFHYNERYFAYYIEYPFKYIETEGIEVLQNLVLLRDAVNSHDFYTIYGDKLPKPVYFDSASGLMSDEYFDIHKVYEQLKDREDIVWEKNKRNDSVFVDTWNGYGLKFRLIPTPEMWKVIKDMNDTFNLREYLIREVFDIAKYRMDKDNDKDDQDEE